MEHRQTALPRQWLVIDGRLGDRLWAAIGRLPAGSGMLVLRHDPALLAKLRRIARARRLMVFDEAAGEAARVHNMDELRRALARGVRVLFLSPMFPTRSHPGWRPMPRMRAATLARLAKRPVVALGGMDARRFRALESLGFLGWAGIDAWLDGASRE